MKRALWLLFTLVPAAVLADTNITIDGSTNDWNNVTTCFSEPTGDGQGGIDLTRACIENNNSSGSNGSLFTLYQAASLPNEDRWFGFSIDLNNDGVITNADEVWAVYFARNGNTSGDALQVYDPITYTVRRQYNRGVNCGSSGTNRAWSARRNGNVIELAIGYGCLGLTTGTDKRRFQLGAYPNFDTTVGAYYDGVAGTLVTEGPAPDVISFTVLSTNGQSKLNWTNPAGIDGLIVLRSVDNPPSQVPSRTASPYAVGNQLGNATVVYANYAGNPVSTLTQSGQSNGTRYHYKIYTHHQHRTYSPGLAPSSQGLLSIPTNQQSGSPRWCYNVGLPTTQQPFTEAGAAVYTSSNARAFTGNVISNTTSTDGNERWRPVQLSGVVQSRATVVGLHNRTGTYILTGDHTGRAYCINSATGALVWTANSGNSIGERIQAQAAVQLREYADAAFRAKWPNMDLVFFATRNNSTTNNRVVAVSSVDGSVKWTYQPNNLDIVSGGMMVDYAKNRLWVASRAGSNGNQASLRAINTLTGAEAVKLNLGDIDAAVVRNSLNNEAYVAANNGWAYGIDLSANNPTTWKWRHAMGGAVAGYLMPVGQGFLASTATGVQRYAVDPVTKVVTPVWSKATAINGATAARVDFAIGKLYVGDALGRLHQLDLATGANEKSIQLSSLALGMPSLDTSTTPKRLYVGGLDGRLCAVNLPL